MDIAGERLVWLVANLNPFSFFTLLNSLSEMAPSNIVEKLYPPELSASESAQLLSAVKDWSIAHGLAVRPPVSVVTAEADPHGILATTAPVTLFPSPFPRICFEQAKSIQRAYNRLYASIAQNEEFLRDIVQEWACSAASHFNEISAPWNDAISELMNDRIVEVDEFIAELWQVHLRVKEEGYIQVCIYHLFKPLSHLL